MTKRLRVKTAQMKIRELQEKGKILVPETTAKAIRGLLSSSAQMDITFKEVHKGVFKIEKGAK